MFSEDCELDAGGREVTWLDGVRPADSVALLESLVTAQPGTDRRDRVLDGAISGRSRCTRTTSRPMPRWSGLARQRSQPQSCPHARCTFWLGNSARRARGVRDSAPESSRTTRRRRCRKKAVFGLTQSKEAEAVRRPLSSSSVAQQTPSHQRPRRSDLLAGAEGGQQGRGGDHRARSSTIPTPR